MSEGIRISIGLDITPDKVWEALTVPDKFKAWFTSCEEIVLELEPGGRAVFAGGSEEGSYRSEGTVLDVIPGRKLFHTVLEGHDPTWYGGLLWRLEPEGEGTRLTLAEAGFEGREEEIADIEEGWRALLLSLCRFLEGSDRPDLPEDYYEITGQDFASAFGYSYAPPETCWERIMAVHGNPELKVLGPCGLIGDHAPSSPGAILDAIPGRKLMYTTPENGWRSITCWSLEDVGSERKISFFKWGYEERAEELAGAQKVCDELMDRLVAGLDAISPEPEPYEDDEEGYDDSYTEGFDDLEPEGGNEDTES